MRIKAVNHMEQLGNLRCLLRQIGCGASAKDHNIRFAGVILEIIILIDGNTCSRDLNAVRAASGSHKSEFCVGILADCKLNALSKVAVADNTDTDFVHDKTLLFDIFTLIL